MYLNMYRAGRLNNPGRRGIARNDRSRERRQPWRIRQASSGAGRDDGEKEKNSLPVALSIDATGTMPQHHLLLIIHHARSERQEPVARPGGRIRPGTRRRRQAGARLKKEEAGGKKLGRPGAQRARGAGLATTRHQQSGTRPSSPPPQPSGPPAVSARVFRRLLLRISEKVRRYR